MTDKKQPTDLAGYVASDGAAAPVGSEAPPPQPEPAAAPEDLPKALSAEERESLLGGFTAAIEERRRAVALIDALTQTLAQQAAQIFADGQALAQLRTTVVSLTQDLEQARAEKADERRIAGDAWDRVRQLEQILYDERVAAAAQARVRELEAERDRLVDEVGAINNSWHTETMRKLAAEQKMVDANALLRTARSILDGSNAAGWCERCDSHLSGQPAAPSRTDPVDVDLENGFPCEVCGKPCMWGSRHVQCAEAPSRTEAEQALRGARDVLRKLNPRVVSEAEQAVLDAMAAVPLGTIRLIATTCNFGEAVDLEDACKAELARRGLNG